MRYRNSNCHVDEHLQMKLRMLAVVTSKNVVIAAVGGIGFCQSSEERIMRSSAAQVVSRHYCCCRYNYGYGSLVATEMF